MTVFLSFYFFCYLFFPAPGLFHPAPSYRRQLSTFIPGLRDAALGRRNSSSPGHRKKKKTTTRLCGKSLSPGWSAESSPVPESQSLLQQGRVNPAELRHVPAADLLSQRNVGAERRDPQLRGFRGCGSTRLQFLLMTSQPDQLPETRTHTHTHTRLLITQRRIHTVVYGHSDGCSLFEVL